MSVFNKLKMTIGAFLFPELADAVAAHKALKDLVFTRGETGGVVKRIDENRELLELLLCVSPELLNQSPWVVGWIKANDSFFIAAADIISQGRGGGYAVRAWPILNK